MPNDKDSIKAVEFRTGSNCLTLEVRVAYAYKSRRQRPNARIVTSYAFALHHV
jgi:hypothetical protein